MNNQNLNLKQVRKRNEKLDKKNGIIRCPNCSETDLEFLGNKKKGFSVGKAVAGGVLTGGIGTLAGFAGKKGKEDKYHCKNCGLNFEKKA